MEAGPSTVDLDARRSAWARLRPPDGWEPVAELVRSVADDLDALTDRIADRLAEQVPAYRDAPVPDADLRASIARTSETVLLGLAERRGPTAREVVVRRELGRRRAHQGVSAEDLLAAYRIGHVELWRALVAEVEAARPELATTLLGEATLLWRWGQELSDAVGAAHATAVRELQAQRISARQRLAELLTGPGDSEGPEARRLAATLGLDADGAFRALVVQAAADDPDAVALQAELDALAGRSVVAARGDRLVVLLQGADATTAVARCRETVATAGVAVGAARSGLAGARASVADAGLALALRADGHEPEVVDFEQQWLWATLRTSRDRLEPLLAPGARLAADRPHLAAAVAAFADGAFSASRAARILQVHPNTVAYRLERWAELSGWDPRTFDGLVRSMAALRLPTPSGARRGPDA